MKKNFVQKLALGLALVMAVTSVPATSEAAAKPGFKSSAVKVRVNQTKKYNTVNASKYSVKFKIGNKDVATIKYSTGSKAVRVTGVEEGKTTLRADFKSYKTKKVTTVKIPVNVLAAKVEAPVVVEAALSGVAQTTSDTIRVSFSADASKKFTKDSFSVVSADGTRVMSVKAVNFSADGLSADLTVYHTFDNGTTYNVTCGGTTKSFIASIGEVARIAIHTASAQQNVKTPISFTLYDANGIDITKSIDLDSKCVITVTNTHSGANILKASEAYLTMNTVGDTATVTIAYNSGKVGATDVSVSQTITCVAPNATIGKVVFADTTVVNDKSKCAKFYLGLSDSVVALEENEVTDDVYFCAKDSNGDVISYDSYSVESSNEDVMNVVITDNVDSGKYSRFEVTANAIGSAQIIVTAEKNGVATKYTVPVTISKVSEAVKMDVALTRPVMSDVVDYDYFGVIAPTLYDAKGNEVDGTFDYELTTITTVGTEISVTPSVDTQKATVKADNAVAKTYTVKVTGSDNKTGKTIVKNVNITVKALPEAADVTSGAGIKLTYQVELKDTTLGAETTSFNLTAGGEAQEVATTGDMTNNLYTRLYATYNGLFAGYVRDINGNIVVGAVDANDADGEVAVDATTQLADADVLVRFGNLAFNEVSYLLGAGKEIDANKNVADNNANNNYKDTLETIGTTWKAYAYIKDTNMTGTHAANTVGTIVYGDVIEGTTTRSYAEVARAGQYVIEYNLTYVGATKPVVKSQSFTMNDKVLLPTVTVESRKINNLVNVVTNVAAVLATNVDMNNNISEHESIVDVWTAKGETPAMDNNNKLTVKYAVVVDNYAYDWNFWVPVNTTFTVE